MISRSISYTDYNGTERTETFYFNFTQAELVEMQLGVTGGFEQMVKNIIASKDLPSLIKIFKKLVLDAYGEKSPDGRQFIKNDEVRNRFAQTEAYSKLFMELATDDKAAADFINGLIPKGVDVEEAKKAIAEATADVTGISGPTV